MQVVRFPASISIRPERIFAAIGDQPGFVWLDATLRVGDRGRYSFMAWSPVAEVVLQDSLDVASAMPTQHDVATLEELLNRIEKLTEGSQRIAIGYITYEAMLPWVDVEPRLMPRHSLAHFYIYDHLLCYDNHVNAFVPFAGLPFPALPENSPRYNGEKSSMANEVSWSSGRDDYTHHFNAIKKHITEGDIYQANLTMRGEVNSTIPPLTVYRQLRRLNPAPHGAFVNTGAIQILSSSPERMFRREGDFVTTSPIKGTAQVGTTPEESTENRAGLLHSGKDRAELLMIVDLLRNDLGKVGRCGSVTVDHLFRAESYSSVHHLVSDVSCRLRPGVALAELCRALMPGGSITGAPKRRAVEILQQQETVPRGVYTGCIGYVTGKRAEFNIAIRTMTHHDSIYHLHAGSGIVADSTVDGEHAETLLKARNLLRAVGVCR